MVRAESDTDIAPMHQPLVRQNALIAEEIRRALSACEFDRAMALSEAASLPGNWQSRAIISRRPAHIAILGMPLLAPKKSV
jgi:hypothetical protein